MEIKVETKAGEADDGKIYIHQNFKTDENTLDVVWGISSFEMYLAECYRIVKSVKLKLAKEEIEKKNEAKGKLSGSD